MKSTNQDLMQVMADDEAKRVEGGWVSLSLGGAIVNAVKTFTKVWSGTTTTTTNATSLIAHEQTHIVMQ